MVYMEKVAVLSCVLGGYDTPVDPVPQDIPIDFHRWTDENFPPIAQWDPRLQYRIPKTHGWEMYPGFDYYIWIDGSVTMTEPYSASWYRQSLGDGDIALFAHPTRKTIAEEVFHIEDHLRRGKSYITDRYRNGLHGDQPQFSENDPVYASTAFIYRNTPKVQAALRDWWYYQSRYYTCDQVNLTYALQKHKLDIRILEGEVFKSPHALLQSKH